MMKTFKEQLHLPVTMIDDSARMLAELKVPSRDLCAANPHYLRSLGQSLLI